MTSLRWCVVALACALGAGLVAGVGRGQVVAQQAPEDGSSPLEIEVMLTPPTVRLGERTDLVISVRHSSDLQVSARLGRQGSAVRLIEEDAPEDTLLIGETAFTTIRFTFAAFEVATHPLDTVEVSWLRADGSTGSVQVTPPPIEVVALRAADDATLRPLKPQATIVGGPAGWVRPAILAGVAIAVVVAVAASGSWLWWRRGHEVKPAVVVPDVMAEQSARQRLDVAATIGPRNEQNPDYQSYYGELASVVRAYLTERFGFNAAALTTRELEDRMTAQGVGRWQARLVSGLLDRCDAAVFARTYPDPTSADHDLTVAFEIIELSRPRTQTAAEADADAPVPV